MDPAKLLDGCLVSQQRFWTFPLLLTGGKCGSTSGTTKADPTSRTANISAVESHCRSRVSDPPFLANGPETTTKSVVCGHIPGPGSQHPSHTSLDSLVHWFLREEVRAGSCHFSQMDNGQKWRVQRSETSCTEQTLLGQLCLVLILAVGV